MRCGSVVQHKVRENAAEGEQESPQEAAAGRQGVGLSYAPEFRLILAAVVGPRTSETALTLIHQTARIVSGMPAVFSDGFSAYLQALIDGYHTLTTFPRTGKPRRPKNPIKEPYPDLVYGQIVKKKRKRRGIEITTRILWGAERFAERGLTISTTLLERLNLTFRQALAPLGRRILSFSKERSHLEQHTWFFQAFYNVARPHMSLREKIIGNAHRFAQKWKQRTPAMTAGLTDHVWTFRNCSP